jgi:ribonuclease P protein component
MPMNRNARVQARLAFSMQQRLRRKADFDAVHARGVRVADEYFAVIARANALGHARLGLAVSVKTAGGGVSRNRIRRLVREAFRLHQHVLPAADIVVSARQRARGATRRELRASVEGLWKKISERCASSSSV